MFTDCIQCAIPHALSHLILKNPTIEKYKAWTVKQLAQDYVCLVERWFKIPINWKTIMWLVNKGNIKKHKPIITNQICKFIVHSIRKCLFMGHNDI